jgi:hypothetical protein
VPIRTFSADHDFQVVASTSGMFAR